MERENECKIKENEKRKGAKKHIGGGKKYYKKWKRVLKRGGKCKKALKSEKGAKRPKMKKPKKVQKKSGGEMPHPPPLAFEQAAEQDF